MSLTLFPSASVPPESVLVRPDAVGIAFALLPICCALIFFALSVLIGRGRGFPSASRARVSFSGGGTKYGILPRIQSCGHEAS